MVRKRDTKTALMPPSRTSTYPQSRGNNLHRTEQCCRGFIRKGAGEYENKRIREAEQKRALWKATVKISSTELSSSDLSCPDCNNSS